MVEITDPGSLRAWLKAQPPEVAVPIAARAALRSAPLLVFVLDSEAEERRATIVLPSCRAMTVASFAGKWPKQATEIRAQVYASAVDAASAASASYAASYAAAYAAADADAMWRAVSQDINLVDALLGENLRQSQIATDLSSQPLWHSPPPRWAAEAWERLKAHLLTAGEGWEVWTGWYEDRLDGRFGPRALELARATIPDEDWSQGPAHVNAIIRRLIEEHTERTVASTQTAALPELPDPRPAPVVLEFREGALRKAPMLPAKVPEDRRPLVEQAWQALAGMLSDLIATDPGRNSPRLARVLEACRSSLGATLAETEIVALGVHAARLQGLAERADEVLMPEDAADLVALNAQLGLFLGQFPDWADYARGLSGGFGTPQAEAQAVEDGVAAINAIDVAVPDIIAPDAKKELAALADATQEPTTAGSGDVPHLARRSFLRSLRSGLLALSRNALSVVQTGVRKGVEKHFEATTAAALSSAQTSLLALAMGLPSEFGWLAGVVTYLTRTLGPSRQADTRTENDIENT